MGSVPQFAENAISAVAPKEPSEIPFEWPWQTEVDGLWGVGGKLTPGNLFGAYSHGIFPWPHDGLPMLWFSPDKRGLIPLRGNKNFKLKAPASFMKFLKKTDYEISWNRAFEDVITGCKFQKRPGQAGTWITDEVGAAYIDFHKAGYAHSIECWQEGRLIGGLYGVFVKGVFSAESMFHREPDASKLCLWNMINTFKDQDFDFVDIQMVTEITARFGGILMPRRDYLLRLQKAQKEFLHR